MAAAFSASDAALAGFYVIRRHWRVVAGWAGFNVLAVVALIVLTIVIAVPVGLLTGAGAGAASPVGAIAGLIWALGYLLVQIVVICGLYRLMLRPQEPAFLHLRLSAAEMRVLAVTVLYLLVVIIGVVLLRVGLPMVAKASPGVSVAALGVLLIAGWIALLRFNLAAVLSFAEGRVMFLESWRRTRGYTWALAGMSLLMICLVALIAVVVWIVLFVIGGLMTGFHDLGLSGAESFTAHPGRYLFQIAAEMLLGPFFAVILHAPWVAVYRAIGGGPPQVEPQA